jgi:peptide/nickel transport system substrate-binding protein
MKKRLWLALSLFVIGALVLAACQPAATTEAPKPTEPPKPTSAAATEPPKPTEVPEPTFSGTVTITFVQEPDNLNPLYTTMFFSGITRDFWLKGLWSFDENNQPVPELAAEVPTADNGGVSADGKTLTIKLRDDVTWSDGTPLTADDFVFTYQMIMSEKNVAQTRYPYEDYVESVEAQDAHTVVVKFKEPFAAWLTNIFSGTPSAGQGVLPKHILQPVFDQDGTLDNAAWNRAPTVGIGPFVFKEWESGSHLVFTANPKWIRPPKVEQIFVRIVPDDAAQEAAILAGDTDVGVFLSSDQIEKLEAGSTVDVVAVASGYDEGWFLNVNPETAHPAMLDVNVRKAIALGTDRFTIVKDLLVEEVNPVNATFWEGTAPYGDPSLKPYPYDPEQAKQLLDQAGWKDTNGDGIRDKDGVELKLRYITNDRQLRMDVQAVVQQQWAAVGIGAELVNYSSDVYWNGYNDGGPQAQGLYDVAEYSSVGSFPDPEISNNWLCSQISSAENPDGANWQGYCNPQMDELLKKQATTLDRDERIQLYYQIEKLIYDEVIYIGMWKDPDLWSVNQRLQGVKLSGATPFWNAHEWSVSQ